MELEVKDNPKNKRYEANVDGEFAIIEYIKAKDTIYLTHTEVPKSMEGKGIGSKLVIAALRRY